MQFFNIIFFGFAPFFNTSQQAIAMALKEINPKDDLVIYELGSGWARFLQAVEKINPQAKLEGIEYSRTTYWLSKIHLHSRHSHIKLLRKNLFKVNLAEADVIYCYLLTDMMFKLGEKIKAECRPGTKIISHMFSIPNMEIKKKVEVDPDVLYIYEV